MIRRANRIRTAAGLPPLLDSGLISLAADNHSRYWTLNRAPAQILEMHGETPGRPGFTGASPSTRCDHVGTTCGYEVMFPGHQAVAAVNYWTPTLFHGAILTSPYAWAAGGAVHGRGPAVMDFAALGGLLTAPMPFPNRHYRGDLFYWGEAPDPSTVCRGIRPPYGPTIFLNPPLGGVLTSLKLVGPHHRRIRGCTVASLGGFVPTSMFQAHSRYRVTAHWHLGAVPETTSWSFHT
jgi:hypothetical protein